MVAPTPLSAEIRISWTWKHSRRSQLLLRRSFSQDWIKLSRGPAQPTSPPDVVSTKLTLSRHEPKRRQSDQAGMSRFAARKHHALSHLLTVRDDSGASSSEHDIKAQPALTAMPSQMPRASHWTFPHVISTLYLARTALWSFVRNFPVS